MIPLMPAAGIPGLPPGVAARAAAVALREDIGHGDMTTAAVVPPLQAGRAIIRARQQLVLAGLEPAREVFAQVDPALCFTTAHADGDDLAAGDEVARIEGKCRSLLTAERTALNFLQHLSGIASLAARAVERVRGTGVLLLDTRKTTPGLRILEKHAVRAGGGVSHRSGLDDGILIKDNHIACCPSPAEAVRRARTAAPALLRIEVEIDSLDSLEAVVEAGADMVLLDNFRPQEVAEAVRLARGRVVLEASGGIDLDLLPAYAATGVQRIALGFLTHSAPAADLALEIELVEESRGH